MGLEYTVVRGGELIKVSVLEDGRVVMEKVPKAAPRTAPVPVLKRRPYRG